MRFLAKNALLLILIEIRRNIKKALGSRFENLIPKTLQTFLRSSDTDFVEKVAKAFLSDDIPLYKLNNTHIKNLFCDIGQKLPSETTCRRTALQLSEDELKRIRNAVHDKQIFFIVDESTLSGTQYLNIAVGSLETPHVSYLYDCQPLKCAPNSNIIAQAVDDAVRNLGINRSFFCLLLSDAAKYMIAAGITLKSLYPKLFHVTCVAHLLHNCAMKTKSHFEDVDQLIAKVKAVAIKNKTRQAKFSAIDYPPKLVPTRWGSWLNAALYYAKSLPEVKVIVESFVGSRILVTQAKVNLQKSGLAGQLLKIKNQYKCLVKLIEKMESAKYTIKEAVHAIQEADFGKYTCNIKQYTKKRMQNNDIFEIINTERQDISPAAVYYVLQNSQPTFASVERSFSMSKKLSAKDRNFKVEHVRHCMSLHF